MIYRRSILAIPLIALFLIACNVNALMPLFFIGQQSTTNVEIPQPPPTIAPPPVVELVELEESATYTDTLTEVTFDFSYPAGWQVDDVMGLILVSDESALDALIANESAPPSGEIGGTVTVLNSETLAMMGGDTSTEPEAVLNFMLEFIDPESDLRLGDMESVMFVDNAGAIITGRGNLSNTSGVADLWIATVDIDGTFVIAIFMAPRGEMTQYEDTLFAIMSSIAIP